MGCTNYGHFQVRFTNSGSSANGGALSEPLSMRPILGLPVYEKGIQTYGILLYKQRAHPLVLVAPEWLLRPIYLRFRYLALERYIDSLKNGQISPFTTVTGRGRVFRPHPGMRTGVCIIHKVKRVA